MSFIVHRVGSALMLEHTACNAVVARDNCMKAAGLAAETLRILDNDWRKTHGVNAVCACICRLPLLFASGSDDHADAFNY
jgi:hypothetical protein